jgi:hypothetical protein
MTPEGIEETLDRHKKDKRRVKSEGGQEEYGFPERGVE